MKFNVTKIKIALLALSILPCLMLAGHAHADGMLFVSPTRINLDEKKKVEIVNVSNVTATPRTYKISIEDLVMTEAGVTVQSDQSEFSAKKMIRFFPREFTVEPGQRQAIRVMARIPADTPDGEYHSHIKFFEDITKTKDLERPTGEASKARMKAAFSYSTLLPITLSKGNIDTKVGWIDPVITTSKTPDHYTLKTQITREGNGQGNAYIDLFYISPSGQSIQIGKRRTIYVYREINKKNFNYDFKLPEGAGSSGKIKLSLFTGDRAHPTLVNEVSLSIP